MKLTTLILLLLPLAAQEPAALAIRNLRFDDKTMKVDFDVADTGVKPVRSWLMTVVLGHTSSFLTPQNCSSAGHCQVDFSENSDAPQPEVRVNAVLFEDGTATGDLRMLQDKIDEARIRLRALESWQRDFDKTPPDIAYTLAAMNEREIVEAFAAKETPEQIAAMLRARVSMARELTRLFPMPEIPYAQEADVLSNRPIANRSGRFPIIREEERNGRLRLVMRNDYDKEIIAFAFIEHRPEGPLMSSLTGGTIAPGGFQQFDYGPMNNPVELACVIFRDGTDDGDPAVARKMRDGWAGRDAEKARILPLVRAVANLSASARATAIDNLIADLKAHPQEQPDASHSIDFVLSEQGVRKEVINELTVRSLEMVLKYLQE